ncbi:MAG: hypothetical protein ACYSU8_00780 [Planctomycetota bacterium]
MGLGQFRLLADGFFDLIGPILIFGIYIIASIAKKVAKKGQTEDSDVEIESELKKAVRKRYEQIRQRQSIAKKVAKKGQTEDSDVEIESELKKAVRKRYEQIRQRQLGQQSQQPPQVKRPPKAVPVARPVQQEQSRPRQMSQWEQQQQTIRQRNAKLQEQRMATKRQHANVLKQSSKTVRQPKPKQAIPQKLVQTQKKKIQHQAKTVSQKKQQAGNLLSYMINRPENLRSAIILKEILDKPLALRDI